MNLCGLLTIAFEVVLPLFGSRYWRGKGQKPWFLIIKFEMNSFPNSGQTSPLHLYFYLFSVIFACADHLIPVLYQFINVNKASLNQFL